MKFICCTLLLLFIVCSCQNETAIAPSGPYFEKVKVIIADNCLNCHSSSGDWSGRPVKFDTDSDITDLAGSIKAAVAGPFTFMNKQMPQGGALSKTNIDIIVSWYKAGGRTTD